MASEAIIEIVKRYADIIKERFPVKRVILFGSYARGTQHLHSDIDVAVVLKEQPKDFLDAETELFSLCRDIDIRIEPVIVDEQDDPGGFYEEISSYGTEVYPG
jgi:predicted nucleotidyltransferase